MDPYQLGIIVLFYYLIIWFKHIHRHIDTNTHAHTHIGLQKKKLIQAMKIYL